MRHKEKWAALVLALALLVQPLLLPAQAAPTVYFTAVNDYVLELSDDTMPFWSGGYLYLPSTIFTGSVGRQLGISYSRYVNRQTVILYSSDTHALIFDLANNTTKDNQGNAYAQTAILRGGVVFVPEPVITSFFGITCTRTAVPYGYLVRLRNSEAVLSDQLFADAASYTMEERYDQYLKTHTEEGGQTDGGTQGVTPSVKGKSVYLCLSAQDPELVEDALEALELYGGQATFYCSLEFLEEQGDLLRRMEVSGQGIGILADSADPERTAAEQLERGNELLYRAACAKTRLVCVENASERTLSDLAQAGYCCLQADMDRTAYALTSSASAQTLLQRVSAHSGNVSVWLGESVSGTGLRSFLQKADQADDRCLAMTETVS